MAGGRTESRPTFTVAKRIYLSGLVSFTPRRPYRRRCFWQLALRGRLGSGIGPVWVKPGAVHTFKLT